MIPLHLHTTKGSILDSTIEVDELIPRLKELGMNACAITDHGTVHCIIDFYSACKKEGIKPLIGVEAYVCDDMKVQDPNSRYDHLILIAKNNTGYMNILNLVTKGCLDGFYYKPRIDFKTLSEHKEGLIIATACLGGEIPRMILKNRTAHDIQDKIMQYKETFEDFYLELQSANNDDQKKVNQALYYYSKLLNVPMIVTSDSHFLRKEDFEAHGRFIQINTERDNEFYQDCWVKSEDEVMEVLADHVGFEVAVEAIANTHAIADKCNVEIELGKSYLPDFPIPKQFADEHEYLRNLINRGFKNRGLHLLPKDKRQEYIDRLAMEFNVIKAKNFSGYFLIMKDLIDTCKDMNILVEPRGSACNSLCCYVLGITNIDSVAYQLNFSRFLTMERVSLPDIDLDVPSSKRHLIIDMLRDKYGHDKVAQIISFGTLQAKSLFDSLGKVYNKSYNEIETIKKAIPDGLDLATALRKSAKLAEYEEKNKELFASALKLEGLVKSTGQHAGGVVICPQQMNLTDFTALLISKEGHITTQLEMHNIEEVGLVKMDILGVAVLDTIQDTLDMVYGDY